MRRLKSFGFLVSALLLTGSVGGGAKPMHPGVERWGIKTTTISGAAEKSVALDQLIALPDAPDVSKNDARYQDDRIPQPAGAGLTEGDLVTTTGWLHLVASETDGDYHIQISADQDDGGNCVVVEVPKDDEDYTPSADLRTAESSVRSWIRTKLLRGREPSTSGSVMTHPVYVRVTGQLFYDDSHVGDEPRGKKGMKAATLWELHPVTEIGFASP
jgi:hypothetical protein